MALGAGGLAVRGMVLRQVGLMTAIGASLGAVGAWWLGRVSQSLLFEVGGQDPLVFGGALFLLAAIAAAAGWVPALRASRTHPMSALRYD
jgi:ABC-type antimicrobial peptide transport system permease subunit